MIDGLKDIPLTLEHCMALLEKSSIKFYLTGSRFFGGATKYSDWDFIVWHSSATENYLRSIGFMPNKDVQNYLDPMTTKVLTLRFSKDDPTRAIDIQLCHDIETKLKIRKILKENYGNIGLGGTKAQKSKLWSTIYNVMKNNT